MPDQYVDPNSGAAPQPGGYAAAPTTDENGPTDTAVADDITKAQEEQEEAAKAEAEESDPDEKEKAGRKARPTTKK